MPDPSSQTCLRELDKKLWTAAVKLRSNLDAVTDNPADRGSSARSYKITSTGKLIDDALEAIEKENVNGAERHRRPSNVARRVRAGARIKLKGVLDRRTIQLQIDPANRVEPVRLPGRAARRGRAVARINLSSLVDLIASDLKY